MKADYILLQDRLKGEYKDAFQKVQMYSTSNLIGEDTESELMMELLDHMLMAQEEGKPVSTIVGDDIEGFCEICWSLQFWILSSEMARCRAAISVPLVLLCSVD